MALKFVEHFLWIASSMTHLGGDTGMWDEEDGFFYDVLRLPNGQAQRLKVRSMVGLLPLCAATVFDGQAAGEVPGTRRAAAVVPRQPARTARRDPRPAKAGRRRPPARLHPGRNQAPPRAGEDARRERVPQRVRHPLAVALPRRPSLSSSTPAARSTASRYLPAESDTGMFGGNSNWRGPIWMPVNALIIRALLQYYTYYGNDFTVECPTGSGRQMNLYQVAEEIARRLANIFLQGQGRPPARLRRHREVPGRPALARSASCSTSTSTATTAPASAPATRPAGPASSPGSCTCSRPRRPNSSCNWVRPPGSPRLQNSRGVKIPGCREQPRSEWLSSPGW